MKHKPTKSSGGSRRVSYQSTRNSWRPQVAAPDDAVILAALAAASDAVTATQLAATIGSDVDGRALGGALRRLVEQGQVLETRPGRYRASGSNGEFSAVLESDDGATVARVPDGKRLRVNPAYTLGAGPGDVVQVLLGEDGLALITRILRRSGRPLVGLINVRPGGPVLVPDARREGELPIVGAFPGFFDRHQAADRVVARLVVDARGNPGAVVERIIGAATPEIADFEHVRLVHDLPGEHPPAGIAEAAAYRQEGITADGRIDLRDELVFTIDPATAKDFDDAISLKRDSQGRWELGVHIADVAHYVRPGTALDGEAATRGTSCYLVNRVIPMLPETLSNGLCSLVPRQNRYCLSAFCTLDRNAKLLGVRLGESLINSRHRLTYEEAMAVLDGSDEPGKWPDDLRTVLKQVGGIAQQLRTARVKAGALNLYSVERRFVLDVEGNPIEVVGETTDASHQLIEECMLLANRAVAAWLDQRGLPCPYPRPRAAGSGAPAPVRRLAGDLRHPGRWRRRPLRPANASSPASIRSRRQRGWSSTRSACAPSPRRSTRSRTSATTRWRSAITAISPARSAAIRICSCTAW